MGMKTLEGDEAFYYLHNGNELMGMVLSHVDDFTIAGCEVFVKDVIKTIERELTVSKVEQNSFGFTGVDVKKTENSIEVSMEDYVESLQEVKNIRTAKKNDELLPSEMKLFRGYTGKIAWLADNVRPDMSYSALEMTKKGRKATITDMKKVNQAIRKIKDQLETHIK